MSEFDTSVPNITISDDGISVPSTEEILAGVLKDFNTAFGGNLNITNVASPQYVLASEITQAISLQNAGMALTLSQFDPNVAMGRFQDAIGRIYFIDRKVGTPTIVQCTLTGIPDYTFNAGELKAQDTDGNVYVNIDDVKFNALGIDHVEFKCMEVGAIPCPAGSLTRIYEVKAGWDAITNETAGDVGTDIESRDAFESRRYSIVAKNGQSSVSAIYGAIRDLDDVADAYVTENSTNNVMYVGETDVALPPHSIYICVVGGNKFGIGEAILKNKTVGASTVGNTEVTVYDINLGKNSPPYTFHFQRPDFVQIHFKVEITANSLLPTNIDDLVKDAIENQFIDDLTEDRYGIGGSIYASRFIGAITAVSESVDIADIHVSTDGETWENFITVGIDQMPALEKTNISVVVE